jgi:hypothetical protein
MSYVELDRIACKVGDDCLLPSQTNASLHYLRSHCASIDEKRARLAAELDDLTADDASKYAMN